MRGAFRRVLLPALSLVLAALLALLGTEAAVTAGIPPWRDAAGDDNYLEKITGRYLLGASAARPDTLLVFGSSELRTTEISTHPANFFAGKRAGFQVDLIGRGSCQSIIHAIQIAASGESLRGKKVVLITSPQSYVPEGIAPDLFAANFSPQQYLTLLMDDSLSAEVKEGISRRVAELLAAYADTPGAAAMDPAVEALAASYGSDAPLAGAERLLLEPYLRLSRRLWEIRDKASAARLLRSLPEETAAPAGEGEIDWRLEEAAALAEARAMTAGNDFGMLDGYYTTYIGTRLERQKDRDKDLDYSRSKEYGDLRLLFEVCRQKGIRPLFVHLPLHGRWSDYTGFPAERRRAYYDEVRGVAAEYGIEVLDLTGYEYEQYFLCDVMHLGWKGWLAVDRALIDYYYSG